MIKSYKTVPSVNFVEHHWLLLFIFKSTLDQIIMVRCEFFLLSLCPFNSFISFFLIDWLQRAVANTVELVERLHV